LVSEGHRTRLTAGTGGLPGRCARSAHRGHRYRPLPATNVGLYGFRESTAAALWSESFWVEVAAVIVLAVVAGRRQDS
jgi:hypothetical protein